MTSKDQHLAHREKLLDQIIDRLQSIDRNVEEILERVSDHFGDPHLDLNWRQNGHALDEHRDDDHD